VVSKTRKTLVPTAIAVEGSAFLFKGPTETCQKCNLRAACVEGLEPGRVYSVLEVEPKKKFKCKLGVEMTLVSIERAHLIVALPSKKAVIGATIYYQKPKRCNNVLCPYYKECNPDGVYEGDRIRILREVGKVDGNKGGCDIKDVRLYEVEVK